MAKNFDAKEFLIQKGERVGLFLALIIMIALVGFGMADGISADSVDKTVETIQTKSRSIEDRLFSGQISSDVAIPLDPLYTKTDVISEKIKPEEFLVATPFFRETPLENRKRTNPVVLQPDEFNPVLVRGAVQSMMILAQKDRVQMGVLIPLDKGKAAAPQIDPRLKAWMERAQQQAAMMQAMGLRPPAGFNPAAPGGLPGVAADAGPSVEYRLEWVDAAKIPPNAEPATTVTPVRMAVISASFPYRTQLEHYRSALRKDSLTDLVKENGGELIPHFLHFNVRRRTLDLTGKEKEPWRELNLDADFKPVLATALGTENETLEIRRLSNPGMVMPRPTLAVGKYPDTTPALVAKALRVINQKMGKDPEVRVPTAMERKIAGDGLDIFGSGPAAPDPAPKPKGDAPRGETEYIFPDHCLVRFIDVTVKPGFTYEYQVQIRVQNPNFGKKTEVAFPALAEPKELVSQWSEKPCSITVPRETFVYGVELDEKTLRARQQAEPKLLSDKNDLTFMQIHRWVETTNLNPEQRGAPVPVGAWSIGDCAVRRGEQIGRLENVKVPLWFPNKKAFEIAVPIQAAPKPGIIGGARPPVLRGIPINFTTEDLLVDFEGGKVNQTFRLTEKTSKDVREDANVEYLVMSPDGKLRLRQSRADKVDTERSARYDEWAAWVADVEAGRGRPAAGGGDKPGIKPDPFGKKP